MGPKLSTALQHELTPTDGVQVDCGSLSFPIVRSDKEWKEILSCGEYNVLRLKGMELPATGKYYDFLPNFGYFACVGCHQPLYSAKAKYISQSGWCAFRFCFEGAIHTEVDDSLGIEKRGLMCSACGSHLGHLFASGEFGVEIHSVNSTSLGYEEADPDLPECQLGCFVCQRRASASHTHPMGDLGSWQGNSAHSSVAITTPTFVRKSESSAMLTQSNLSPYKRKQGRQSSLSQISKTSSSKISSSEIGRPPKDVGLMGRTNTVKLDWELVYQSSSTCSHVTQSNENFKMSLGNLFKPKRRVQMKRRLYPPAVKESESP
eukprot:Platyproteum_vivax@DN1346_c0_g1_i1.p1